MAVKVYTPGQFYAAGGVVEEMFYETIHQEEDRFCFFFRTGNQKPEQ